MSIEHFIDTHTSLCKQGWCANSPERFLIYIKGRFLIITYYQCNELYDHLSYKTDLIKRIIGDNRIYPSYEVNRSVNVGGELRDFRIRNKALRKRIKEVNYLYYDNAMKKYAITTDILYIDAVCDKDKIEKNYKDAREFIIKMEYNWLLKQLDDLFYANIHGFEEQAEIHKTIDHLIKEIKKLTNGDN